MQVAPLVAEGTERAFLAVFCHLDIFRKWSLVVHVESNQYIVVLNELAHLLVSPYGQFHLTAVYTTITCKVEHHRLAIATGIFHTGIEIVELSMYFVLIEVEVLSVHRRSECADRLQRSTPQARHHIYSEGQRAESHEEARYADGSIVVIVWELDFAQEVEAHQAENHNPQSEEGFAVEDAPSVSQVGNRQELQGKCQFQETESHLNHVHPATRFRHLLQPRWEHGEEGERQSQCQGKAQHTDGRSYHTAGCRYFYEQETDDRTGTRERYQREGKCHQEDAQETACLFGLAVYGITPLGWESDFECTEERSSKYHQHQEEQDVEYRIGRKGIQGAGTENQGDGQAQCYINHYDRSTICPCIADTFLLVLATLQEEAHGHRDNRPYTRSEQGKQTTDEAGNENDEPRLVGCIGGFFTESIQLVDDRCPIVSGRYIGVNSLCSRLFFIRSSCRSTCGTLTRV